MVIFPSPTNKEVRRKVPFGKAHWLSWMSRHKDFVPTAFVWRRRLCWLLVLHFSPPPPHPKNPLYHPTLQVLWSHTLSLEGWLENFKAVLHWKMPADLMSTWKEPKRLVCTTVLQPCNWDGPSSFWAFWGHLYRNNSTNWVYIVWKWYNHVIMVYPSCLSDVVLYSGFFF